MDWDKTNRKLCIFIPNYMRGSYIHRNIDQFQSSLPSDDWCVVIGCDGHDSSLKTEELPSNFFVFTLDRGVKPESRSGGHIRNYAIKRCQSKWFVQKDPEIRWVNLNNFDTIDSIANSEENLMYRAMYIKMLEEHYNGGPVAMEAVDTNQYFHIHHLLGVQTRLLQAIGGYDEKFTYYGPEDYDIWIRLLKSGCTQKVLPVGSLHFWHPRLEMDDKRHWDMVRYNNSKDPNQIEANVGVNWGEG